MYVLTVDIDTLSKGTPVEVDGLGVFENGYSYDISEEQAEAFRIKGTTQSFSHNDQGQLVVKNELGPTLLQAAKRKNSLIEVRAMTDEELREFNGEEEESNENNDTPEGDEN